jgi:hypothetical protein
VRASNELIKPTSGSARGMPNAATSGQPSTTFDSPLATCSSVSASSSSAAPRWASRCHNTWAIASSPRPASTANSLCAMWIATSASKGRKSPSLARPSSRTSVKPLPKSMSGHQAPLHDGNPLQASTA